MHITLLARSQYIHTHTHTHVYMHTHHLQGGNGKLGPIPSSAVTCPIRNAVTRDLDGLDVSPMPVSDFSGPLFLLLVVVVVSVVVVVGCL